MHDRNPNPQSLMTGLCDGISVKYTKSVCLMFYFQTKCRQTYNKDWPTTPKQRVFFQIQWKNTKTNHWRMSDNLQTTAIISEVGVSASLYKLKCIVWICTWNGSMIRKKGKRKGKKMYKVLYHLLCKLYCSNCLLLNCHVFLFSGMNVKSINTKHTLTQQAKNTRCLHHWWHHDECWWI